jgi:hypothetical protein
MSKMLGAAIGACGHYLLPLLFYSHAFLTQEPLNSRRKAVIS